MKRPAPSIAATLIVRNEARCIGRCLQSVMPWVDRTVVLDTGSTDATAAIAQGLGAEVHHLAWADSFAIARNHVLALADADWNLVIDADEWLLTGGEQLRKWCSGPARLGRICVLSETDGDSAATRSWITRVLPRGARFEGRVHEQVASPLPRVRLKLQIGHDGYRSAQLALKQGRNHSLLLAELVDNPGDPYLLYQLGKDAEMRGDIADACTRFTDAMAQTAADANWRHELVIGAVQCLTRARRCDEALALAEAEFNNWAHSPDFFFVLGDLLLDHAIADPARAIEHWLPLAQGAWERCLEIGERPDLEGSVAGRGSHLAQHNLDVLDAQLALLAA